MCRWIEFALKLVRILLNIHTYSWVLSVHMYCMRVVHATFCVWCPSVCAYQTVYTQIDIHMISAELTGNTKSSFNPLQFQYPLNDIFKLYCVYLYSQFAVRYLSTLYDIEYTGCDAMLYFVLSLPLPLSRLFRCLMWISARQNETQTKQNKLNLTVALFRVRGQFELCWAKRDRKRSLKAKKTQAHIEQRL